MCNWFDWPIVHYAIGLMTNYFLCKIGLIDRFSFFKRLATTSQGMRPANSRCSVRSANDLIDRWFCMQIWFDWSISFCRRLATISQDTRCAGCGTVRSATGLIARLFCMYPYGKWWLIVQFSLCRRLATTSQGTRCANSRCSVRSATGLIDRLFCMLLVSFINLIYRRLAVTSQNEMCTKAWAWLDWPVVLYAAICLINRFKGTVQRKLTGVLSGINRKHMICHCSDGCSFSNLKGLRSLKSKNVISALTGTLL
jgi:hypothetical protein